MGESLINEVGECPALWNNCHKDNKSFEGSHIENACKAIGPFHLVTFINI